MNPIPDLPLDRFFDAASIAFVGASPNALSVRGMVARLASHGFDGRIAMVNPRYQEVFGAPCFPTLSALPFVPELVVVAVGASEVPGLIREASRLGTRAALVVSTGFADAGAAGQANVQALALAVQETGMAVWGPGSFGFAAPHRRMSAFWDGPPGPIPAGNLAVIAQSGGFANVFANAAAERGFGFSYLIATGSELQQSCAHYLRYVLEDEQTQVAVALVEGIKDIPAFEAAAARAVALGKPLLVMVSGRSEAGQRATSAHSGALATRSDVQRAFLERAGALVVETLDDLIETATLLSAWGGRAPTRLAPLFPTISGGDCSLVLDLAADLGMTVPELAADTQADLHALLPESTMLLNPLDLGTRPLADKALARSMLDRALQDPAVNLLMPRLYGRAEDMEEIVSLCRARQVPLVFFTRAATTLDPSMLELASACRVPILKSVDRALAAVQRAVRHAQRLQRLRDRRATDVEAARLPCGRFSEADALGLLRSHGLATVELARADSPEAAADHADRIGYPVVVKVDSADIEHKSDCGGVQLDLRSRDEVMRAADAVIASARRAHPAAVLEGVIVQPMRRPALELIVGAIDDPHYGPAVIMGLGGILAEVLSRSELRLAPISEAEALEALTALLSPKGAMQTPNWRNLDMAAAANFLARFSELAAALAGRFEAMEVNPLGVFTDGRGVLALDGLVLPKARS